MESKKYTNEEFKSMFIFVESRFIDKTKHWESYTASHKLHNIKLLLKFGLIEEFAKTSRHFRYYGNFRLTIEGMETFKFLLL